MGPASDSLISGTPDTPVPDLDSSLAGLYSLILPDIPDSTQLPVTVAGLTRVDARSESSWDQPGPEERLKEERCRGLQIRPLPSGHEAEYAQRVCAWSPFPADSEFRLHVNTA